MATRKPPYTQVDKAKVIALLVQGYTVVQAAEACGMRRNTILNWKKDDKVFREMLEEAEHRAAEAVVAEGVAQAMQGIKDLAPRAREVLDQALGHADVRVQLQAAGMVMKYSAPDQGVQVNVGLEARLAQVNAPQGD